jgi:hypothetical protein
MQGLYLDIRELSMINRLVVLRGFALLAGASMFSTITWAAGAEVSGFGGTITIDSGVGTHPAYGAAAAFRLGDNVHLFGEFSSAKLLTETISGVTASAKVMNYGGGADYSFGSSKSKLRPYVTAGFGVGHFSASGPGISLTINNALYGEVGGGVRLYLGKHWGLKPEARYQRYSSSQSSLLQATIAGSNAVAYTGGLFFQFGD